jgi:hypothetical protein
VSPHNRVRVDLGDTSRCPTGKRCGGCGGRTRLMPATADTPVGVLCLTLCPACVRHHVLPTFYPVTAMEAVAVHCEHLGLDLDQAAAIRAAENGDER